MTNQSVEAEGHSPEIRDLSEADLSDLLPGITEKIEVLRKHEKSLNTEIIPLRAALRTLESQLSAADRQIFTEGGRRKEITERISEIESQREKDQETAQIKDQMTPIAEALSTANSDVSQSLGRVLAHVITDSYLSEILPEILEEDPRFVGKRGNRNRIKLILGQDTCRFLMFSDGSVGAMYNPKPNTKERVEADEAFDKVTPLSGFSVNKFQFGLVVNPEAPQEVKPFVIFKENSSENGQGRKTYTHVISNTEDFSEILHTLGELLANGEILPPQKINKSKV